LDEVFYHRPVLLNEATAYLTGNRSSKGYGVYVDCTLGGGGYTKKILESQPEAKVIAVDRDVHAIEHCRMVLAQFESRIIFVQENFGNITKIVHDAGFEKVRGIVMDLGLSTYQLNYEDGFSYQKDTRLDMRADKDQKLTAKDVLNRYDEKHLARIFYDYGELKYGRQFAKEIVHLRNIKKLETTFDLVELVREKVPPRYLNSDLSKLFQALRIEVNSELTNLEKVLDDGAECLETGGIIAAVSYHSLEDRIVKNKLRSNEKLKVLTKKPIEPGENEVAENTRARSAKLRAAERI
jgi:16S rRNA (cytosine1402-N4)-methyltransferase